MTTIYTKVSKVTGTVYTQSSPGLHIYDDSNVLYDDTNVQYDGATGSYTKVAKTVGTVYTKVTKPT